METEYDWCMTCQNPSRIEDQSEEFTLDSRSGETRWFAIRLECGHDISIKVDG